MITALMSVSLALTMLDSSSFIGTEKLTEGSTALKTSASTSICQQYGDKDVYGSDPHGRDPHDEIHDAGLPANAKETERTATDNVYGSDRYGANSQHPLDNFPR